MTLGTISIIVPVYNVEKYLERCILSLRKQTYPHLEIILVDDGSIDRSLEICQAAADDDPRIKVVHQENGGSSLARNKGLDLASGEFIAFADSDDYLELTTFQESVDLMKKHNLDVIEFERNDLTGKKNLDGIFTVENQKEALKRVIETSSFQVWKRLYKSAVISDRRFIPNIIHQDVFFVIDLLNSINFIGHLNKPLYNYNRENVSVIRSKYSLSKTKAGINATEYLKKNVTKSDELKKTVKKYIVRYYTEHYYLLSRNANVDKDRKFRKLLRKRIWDEVSLQNVNMKVLLGLALPIPIMQIIVKLDSMLFKKPSYN